MKITTISYLEFVSHVLRRLMLGLLVLQVGERLLRNQLDVGELVAGVGREALVQVGQLLPRGGVKLSDLTGADLNVVSQLLQGEVW